MSTNLFPVHYSEETHLVHDGVDCATTRGGIDSPAMDDSLRIPVLALFGNAVHWLVVAAVISMVLSLKLIVPEFLSGVGFLNYGRLAPVARDLFLYGWASQAALAAGLWLASRLSGRPLGGGIHSTLLISAIVLWNLVVLLGSLAILAGYSTGVEWLEYPNWASAALFISFLLIALRSLLLFDSRINERAEVAQWYLVAGFCSFPWVYGTANLLLTWKPVQASAQGAIQSWFGGSFLALWLLPIALAALYALIPRLLSEHLNRRSLAPLGFWSLLVLGGWNGIARLLGGPVPAWMGAVGVVSGVLFLIPVIIIAINLFGIASQSMADESTAQRSIPLRFLYLGAYALMTLGAVMATTAWPSIGGVLGFTGVVEARTQLWLLGAISFPLFGVLYQAVPHLLGRECWSPAISDFHYWLSLVGFWLLIGMLLLGGLFTGLALSDPTISFLNITSYDFPFHVMEWVAQLILLAAAIMLGFNLTRALAGDYLFPKR